MKESIANMVAEKNKITEEAAEVCQMLEAINVSIASIDKLTLNKCAYQTN